MRFNRKLANEIIGKYILIGITYFDDSGQQESQKQLHGKVKAAHKDEGIIIELAGNSKGNEWKMPADTSNIAIAEPGEYKLHSTGEVVINPDYICTWEILKSKNSDAE